MRKIHLLILLLAVSIVYGNVSLERASASELRFKTEFNAEVIEGESFCHIEFEGKDYWSETIDPGAPCLPYREINIAVPPNGNITIDYQIIRFKVVSLDKPVMPAPMILPGEKSSEYIYSINSEKYSEITAEAIKRQEVNDHNGYTIVPVRVYPVILNVEKNDLTLIEEMDINVRIIGNSEFRGISDPKNEWIDKDFIINYQQGKFWREETAKPQRAIPWEKSQFWYKVTLNGSNLYDLSTAVKDILPAWAEYEDLRLFATEKAGTGRKGKEIPLYVSEHIAEFSYSGSNTVLWLAAGGEFLSEPLRNRSKATGDLSIPVIEERAVSIRDSRSIECLLIRPEDYFESSSEELALFHYEHFGVETAIAVQEQIFEDESGGEPDPFAIRSFIEFYESEHPTLEYVVLMGSGTSNFDVSSSKNKIIAWNSSGITSDDNFVDFNIDQYPDLAIGRIPAQSESMMDQYLQRLNDYYNNLESGWWQNQYLLIADDEHKKGHLEGLGTSHMNHTLKMELTLEALPGRIFEKLYGIEYPFDSFQNKPGVSEDMISAINEGRMITYYIGHGSWKGLGDEEYFSNAMIPQLDNYEHLTHFVAGSCNVGNFDQLDNTSMAELLLFEDDGGAICCVTATEESTPNANYQLLKSYLSRLSNQYESSGKALKYAKFNSGAAKSNSKKYNILGDPVMIFPIPQHMGNITLSADSLLHRQTVSYTGDFGTSRLEGEGETISYDSEQLVHYTSFIAPDTVNVYEVDYYKSGNSIFRGQVYLEAGLYNSTFIVPDNAGSGNYGKIITLAEDADGYYVNHKENIRYSEESVDVANEDAPQIDVYLETRSFRNGDTVSETPLLIADIADSSGINLTINSGKNILLLFDGSNDLNDLIDVTSGFIYDKDSYTRGVLTWQLPVIEEGNHYMQLIVYDNFSVASVVTVDFNVIKSGSFGVADLLPYPNPMNEEGYFSFLLTSDAEITISIYTISGKKIRSINSVGNVGYNQVFWDCRDEDGDKIANNTYFFKVKARDSLSGKTAEETGKLIILH